MAGWAAVSALMTPERADMVATLGEVTGRSALERLYRCAWWGWGISCCLHVRSKGPSTVSIITDPTCLYKYSTGHL